MESTGELFIFLRSVLGEGRGLSRRRRGALLARIEWALGRRQKTTYGRSSKKTTVGRSTDLPWVAKTTYRRSFFGGARRLCLDGLESGFEDWACIPSKGSDFLGGGKVWRASHFKGGRSLFRSLGSGALGRLLRLRREGAIGMKLTGCLVD